MLSDMFTSTLRAITFSSHLQSAFRQPLIAPESVLPLGWTRLRSRKLLYRGTLLDPNDQTSSFGRCVGLSADRVQSVFNVTRS